MKIVCPICCIKHKSKTTLDKLSDIELRLDTDKEQRDCPIRHKQNIHLEVQGGMAEYEKFYRYILVIAVVLTVICSKSLPVVVCNISANSLFIRLVTHLENT